MLRVSVFAALVLSTFVEAGGLRRRLHIQRLDGGLSHYSDHLRVCNAYAHDDALDIRHCGSTGPALTGERPLQYKSCRDLRFSAEAGDKFEFAVGGAVLGVFVVSELPQQDGMLLLVVRRHPSDTSTMLIESHAFAHVQSAQLAVFDAYGGDRISSLELKGRDGASLHLRFGSVVLLSPGRYEVQLDSHGEDASTSKDAFEARDGEHYVVLRVGAKHGPRFPEAIVVYPSVSDGPVLESVARAKSSLAPALCASAIAAFFAY